MNPQKKTTKREELPSRGRALDGMRPIPKRPLGRSAVPAVTRQPAQPIPSEVPAEQSEGTLKLQKHSSRHVGRWIAIGVLLIIAAAIVAAFVWYRGQLSPVDSAAKTPQRVTISQGTSPRSVATLLESKHLIRSATAFYIYLFQSGKRDDLQAGTYSLSPSQSTQAIADILSEGGVSELSVTFYPGSVLSGKESDKSSVTAQLKKVGFSDQEIKSALAANYAEPVLFAAKPRSSDLEGYVYGDTYKVLASASAKDVIQRSLDEFASVVQQNNLTALYKKQGLTLYEGITLASILQREVSAEPGATQPSAEQRQVAQVFLKRLKDDMTLGSDVTYIYGAEKIGVTPTPTVDTPYNTRIHKGLPPGPISNPSLSALLAVAHPAKTNYLYFLSGDDGKTYFSKTDAEHQANIAAHCQRKCS